jgi:hypothetical protein
LMKCTSWHRRYFHPLNRPSAITHANLLPCKRNFLFATLW